MSEVLSTALGRGRLAIYFGALLAFALVPADGGASESPDAVAEPFVRVLGTAQDGGLPHAACSGPRCERARREPGFARRVASLALVTPRVGASPAVYLIDASPDIREQLDALRDVRSAPQDRVDRAPLTGVLLTHAHIGHYLGLAFLGFEAVSTSELPVWTTPRMAAYLRENGPWSQLVERKNVELRAVVPGSAFSLEGGVRVVVEQVPHRDEYADTVGFRLEGPRRTLLYVPDTDTWAVWEPSLLERLAGVDVALLDGSFYSMAELPGRDIRQIPHPLITQTMDLLEAHVAAGEIEVYFTHLNHSNPALEPESEQRREIEDRGFHVLSDGAEIGL